MTQVFILPNGNLAELLSGNLDVDEVDANSRDRVSLIELFDELVLHLVEKEGGIFSLKMPREPLNVGLVHPPSAPGDISYRRREGARNSPFIENPSDCLRVGRKIGVALFDLPRRETVPAKKNDLFPHLSLILPHT